MDWEERVGRIRQWRKDGKRAPHKPLLLLYALGHHQRHGDAPILYSAAEEHLRLLLDEFAPPTRSGTTPAYPFRRLANDDGLWLLTTDDGGDPGDNAGRLRGSGARGNLTPEFSRALSDDPGLRTRIARALLDANFPSSLHEEILALAGLALTDGRRVAAHDRDPRFREAVLDAYGHRCAFCGYEGRLGGVPVGLEAAHVRWWSHAGPDDVDNGLALCSNHHLLFDRGVLGLTGELTLDVSPRFEARSAEAERIVTDLAGRDLLLPATAPSVAAGHVDWHRREVFKDPGLAA
ncbi:HNH endonuclease [Nocardiopsis sp. N85]|uniref:phosphorothioated DNA-binding restriction endonuclease n=1 Tax=Nocardiopsis sp. N85 TaxID=3029400 RepID=UPI00237F0F81|nr:HNH endonuclease [Nocardiopsis sp. N85]MDE3722387.1 HNH endonuclease [Nocardiopsis sp. N85]